MNIEEVFPTWRDFARFVNNALKSLIINSNRRTYLFIVPNYDIRFTEDFEDYNPFNPYDHIIRLENPFFGKGPTDLGFDWIIEKQIKEEIGKIKKR